jgi:hypothetical protein
LKRYQLTSWTFALKFLFFPPINCLELKRENSIVLANLKPGIRLELYLAALCFLMLIVIAIGTWWVSQRDAIADDYFYVINPQSAAAARPGNESPQGRLRTPGTSEDGVERTQQRTQKRIQPPTSLQMLY